MNDIRVRRSIAVLCIISLLFAAAAARLAWVQLGFTRADTAHPALSRLAVLQRTDGLVVDTGRGQFRDRQGRPITGTRIMIMAAFPAYGMPRGTEQALGRVASALGVTSDALERWLRDLKEPRIWTKPGTPIPLGLSEEQMRAVTEARLVGVALLPFRGRYTQSPSPLHAIGYVSQDPERLSRMYAQQLASHRLRVTDPIGGAGLEKSMERLLRGLGPTVVTQVTDARRLPLSGLGLRTTGPGNSHFPLQVYTTLDLDIQSAAQQVLTAAGVRQGAAVVLDASNADILAMVSLPRLDPADIGGQDTDERNHAITAYPPGSVFKIVTLAAALESGEARLGDRTFCDGEYHRYGLKCWRREGHGELTLEQAFAESCNVTFAGLAERLNPAWIHITAQRLGLGRQVGWFSESFLDGRPLRPLGEEEPGVVFRDKKTAQDGGVRAGTGIGQRDVRISPLQAANLAVTLLHGGEVTAPRIVKEIRYADGERMVNLPVQRSPSKYGEIHPRTAAAVLKAMRKVVTEGTARQALSASVWPLAGKSGTAELSGTPKARNDHWFVGYGPWEDDPRYAVAILIENQPAGLRNRAASVFGSLMERLRLLEQADRSDRPGPA